MIYQQNQFNMMETSCLMKARHKAVSKCVPNDFNPLV